MTQQNIKRSILAPMGMVSGVVTYKFGSILFIPQEFGQSASVTMGLMALIALGIALVSLVICVSSLIGLINPDWIWK